MSAITTHVLDVSTGVPARGVPIVLELQNSSGWEIIGQGVTDEDGRLRDLIDSKKTLQAGVYRLTFDTKTYFVQQQIEGFYPQVAVEFIVRERERHYHVPLLLSPHGYSTYRGS